VLLIMMTMTAITIMIAVIIAINLGFHASDENISDIVKWVSGKVVAHFQSPVRLGLGLGLGLDSSLCVETAKH
jgi:3-polyprenyl-4-hydroxybenzoate decarboxylase